jgi:SepF-like predicted cell division protein (DUF552 family)
METKAQMARRLYGSSLANLTVGQLAAVTRKFNAQDVEEEDDECECAPEVDDNTNVVEFGRPGNGVKKVAVFDGKNVQEAFDQTGLQINLKKEGFIVKRSSVYRVGQVVKVSDKVYDGDLFMIVPGVDSSK